MELKMTLQQIQSLLDEQKRITIEKLRGQSGYYNKESASWLPYVTFESIEVVRVTSRHSNF